ncbi:hypothetical protein [Catellatospora chokoriensis]|uniref:Uncharacterized protein n=1 Tax=Catellatospora chokoriensis TaxID=310353 RepID=A0A8J3NPJ8_9ACTN|nr:hypothetical protein [Catellatospora chokoriensis]GIF87536.1 hypothetical protein Cch02nite_09800 [Catellatospora chokoriensis]
MTDLDLPDALRRRAAQAVAPPDNLAGIVEGRYRGRRRRRIGASVLATVGALAALTTAMAHLGGGRPDPAATPSPSPAVAQIMPPGGGPFPSAAELWPEIDITLPAQTPHDSAVDVIKSIDATHVLVSTLEPPGFYSYDVVRRTFQQLPFEHLDGNGLRVTPNYIYHAVRRPKPVLQVYRLPVHGGTVEQVAADLPYDRFARWYATDDAVYGSGPTGDGSWTYDIATGRTTAVAGVTVSGDPGQSVWRAERADQPRAGTGRGFNPPPTLALHNIVTGERRDVAQPPGVTEMECSPQLCVYLDPLSPKAPKRYYVQRLDGSGRTALPFANGLGIRAFPIGPLGLFLVGGHLYDPATGRAGSVGADRLACGMGYDGVRIEWLPDQNSPCREHVIWLIDRIR